MPSWIASLLAALGFTQAPQNETWVVATGEVDGKPLIVRFRAAVPQTVREKSHPSLFTIRWTYEGGASGLPDSEIRERMERLEDLLTQHLEKDAVAFHTATITGNGVRELQWYARSGKEMMRVLNLALRGEPPFPIEVAHHSDPGWLAYHELVAEAK
jgi:hypothetical protein